MPDGETNSNNAVPDSIELDSAFEKTVVRLDKAMRTYYVAGVTLDEVAAFVDVAGLILIKAGRASIKASTDGAVVPFDKVAALFAKGVQSLDNVAPTLIKAEPALSNFIHTGCNALVIGEIGEVKVRQSRLSFD
jgi:hypothetical protein